LSELRKVLQASNARIFVLPCLIDIAFICYWIIVAIDVVPEQYMFRDYHTDFMVAWNWSFLPLDILISLTGLAAAVLWRRSNPVWILVMVISLSLMFCAGLQAIAFWWLIEDFDPSWWAMNLVLMIVPLCSVRTLHSELKTMSFDRE